MEKKNMVLLTVIAVATLLVAVVGATFAYFTATITDNRDEGGNEGQAAIKAAQTPGSLIIEESKEGFGSFNETYKLYENCTIDNQLSGEKINKLVSTPLNSPSGETIINGAHPFVITGNDDDKTIYYYVVAAYKNDESSDQGAQEQGRSLNGKLSIKIAASDINAIKDSDDKMSAKNNE